MNQLETSLVAQRVVYDAVAEAGDVLNINIDKSLIQYAKNAHSRYMEAQEQKRQEERENEIQRQKKIDKERLTKDLLSQKAAVLSDAKKTAENIEQQIKELAK